MKKLESAKRNFRLARQLETHKRFLHRSLNKKIALSAKADLLESFYGISDIQSSAKTTTLRLMAENVGVSDA